MISYVQGEKNGLSNVTSVAKAFDSGNGSGNTIVIGIGAWNAAGNTGAFTVFDSNGNSYSQVGTNLVGGQGTSAVYIAKNVLPGANTVTVQCAVASDLSFTMDEVAGLDPTSPLDTFVNNTGNVGGGTSLGSGSLTTGAAGEYLYSLAHNYSQACTFTGSSGYTQRQNETNPDGMGTGSMDNVAGSAGSYSNTVTFSTTASVGHVWLVALIPGGAPPPPSGGGAVVCIMQ